MKTQKRLITSSLFVVSAILVTACVGARQGTLDEISAAVGGKQVFNEAFLDYPGPSEQWAGPARFILHVTAKDKDADVQIPAQWHPVTTVTHRTLASTMTGDQARAKLTELAAAMTEDNSVYAGCSYPIRVRLVRPDGSVLDKEGCREQSKWSKTASETVDYFITNGLK
jgi:hypothetical protein